MKICLAIMFAILLPLSVAGQSTAVTATITDGDGQTWNNGHGFATFYPGPPNAYRWPGGTIQNQYPFTMNGSGTFTVTLPDNTTITPLGSQFTFTLCSNTSAPCSNVNAMVFGSTQDLSSQLSAGVKVPRFAATSSTQSFGYADGEVTPIPVPGGWYFNVSTQKGRQWNGSAWQDFGGGTGGNPCSTQNAIQISNVSSFGCDPNFTINATTHLYNSVSGDMLVGALSSVPRATYDPMDTSYDGGLAAALAGTSGFTPTQVIQAAIDYGECQILQNHTIFKAINIPLPSGVTIPISGLKLWGTLSIGGDWDTTGPFLQHNDATQIMIQGHALSDTLTCNGTTYTPGGIAGVLVHDISIAGIAGPPNTDTDIGVLMNEESSAAINVRGFGTQFGGPAVASIGTSDFLYQMGFPGAQLSGCKTYTSGTRPVSGMTAIVGIPTCAAVMDISLDGGMRDVYASDGQAFSSGHAAGPCYPNCAGVFAGGSGAFNERIFAQVSDIDVIVASYTQGIRADFTSREGVRMIGGSAQDVGIDSACTDTALQAAYNAGTPTGCYAVDGSQATGVTVADFGVTNSAGIFSQAFVQCWGEDNYNQFSGGSNVWLNVKYQGNPNNTTSNDWGVCTGGNDQTASRVFYPSMPGMVATGATINANGLTMVNLRGGPPVTSIIGGTSGQILTIIGTGTVKQGGDILNLNSLDSTITCNSGDLRSCTQALVYIDTGNWVQIAGPPNITPAHVNYYTNPTPSNPSLVDVYGDFQPRQIPNTGYTLNMVNLHGPTVGSGQYCFIFQAQWADGSYTTGPAGCTNVDLTNQTAGELFVPASPQQAVSLNLWLSTNTTGSGLPLGKYPPPVGGFWDGPTVISAGGDGETPPLPNDTTTGVYLAPFGVALNTTATQPTCTKDRQGLSWFLRGTGSTPDAYQLCQWNGSTFAWVTH